jgi:lipopolysaccharide biosynthesis glycosyltransferase
MACDVVYLTARYRRTPRFVKIAIESWSRWCNAHGIRIYVEKHPDEPYRTLPAEFTRYASLELLKLRGVSARNVLIVDSDTLVRPTAYNVFEHHRKGTLSAVIDNGDIHWIQRDIGLFKALFPDTDISWHSYVNTGVMILTNDEPTRAKLRTFLKLLEDNLAFIERTSTELPLHDQTLLNYYAASQDWAVNPLPAPWNLSSLRHRNLLVEDTFLEVGDIIHFNGMNAAQRLALMSRSWRKLQCG